METHRMAICTLSPAYSVQLSDAIRLRVHPDFHQWAHYRAVRVKHKDVSSTSVKATEAPMQLMPGLNPSQLPGFS